MSVKTNLKSLAVMGIFRGGSLKAEGLGDVCLLRTNK